MTSRELNVLNCYKWLMYKVTSGDLEIRSGSAKFNRDLCHPLSISYVQNEIPGVKTLISRTVMRGGPTNGQRIPSVPIGA